MRVLQLQPVWVVAAFQVSPETGRKALVLQGPLHGDDARAEAGAADAGEEDPGAEGDSGGDRGD